MNKGLMMEYGAHISQYVTKSSVLLLDRASSHTSKDVIADLEDYLDPEGNQLFKVLFLPPKTAFLLSPLDNGANSAFKQHFYKYDRSTFTLKKAAVKLAWDAVSNESLLNICKNCGLTGNEPLSSIRRRFERNVRGVVPEELESSLHLFELWKAGAVSVEGAELHRGVELQRPLQVEDGTLDGLKWIEWGT